MTCMKTFAFSQWCNPNAGKKNILQQHRYNHLSVCVLLIFGHKYLAVSLKRTSIMVTRLPSNSVLNNITHLNTFHILCLTSPLKTINSWLPFEGIILSYLYIRWLCEGEILQLLYVSFYTQGSILYKCGYRQPQCALCAQVKMKASIWIRKTFDKCDFKLQYQSLFRLIQCSVYDLFWSSCFLLIIKAILVSIFHYPLLFPSYHYNEGTIAEMIGGSNHSFWHGIGQTLWLFTAQTCSHIPVWATRDLWRTQQQKKHFNRAAIIPR